MLIEQTSIQIVKSDIIAEIERRVKDKILEPANALLLKNLINNAKTTTEAIEIAKLGTIYNRTGFHFDTKCEKVKDNTIKYFKKNKDLSFNINPNGITHKLIIGDNYTALLNLLIEYKNKIDVIYIDPPYGKDSMGEFAQTNYENAITRDNLLSMLYNRLKIAKLLLSETGVIFCSIDDRNQAYVKCLFDEVFEERNFVGTLIHQRAKGGGQAKYIVKGHDYILVYSHDINNISLGRKKIIQGKTYEIDGELYIKNTDVIRKTFGKYDKSLGDRRCFYEELEKYKGKEKKEEIDILIQKGELFLEKNDDDMHIICRYEKVDGAKSKLYSIIKVLSEEGKNELEKLKIPFDYPKPVGIIRQIIEASTIDKKNAIILDFFAGSGTTGQAVLELNKEDGGQRQFILVQLNENLDNALKEQPKSETIKNQIELCDKYKRPHYLSEITADRLRRVMTGKCYDGSSDFPWIKDNNPLGDNLDVYNICEVANNESSEGKTPFDVIDETLYGKEKFEVSEKIRWVIDNFENTQQRLVKKD